MALIRKGNGMIIQTTSSDYIGSNTERRLMDGSVEVTINQSSPEHNASAVTNVGLKFDQDKVRMELLPPNALNEIARVMTYGAKKYGAHNWENGILVSRLLGATLRHINAFQQGIDNDDETNTLHVANAATNLMMIIDMLKYKPEFDDRRKK